MIVCSCVSLLGWCSVCIVVMCLLFLLILIYSVVFSWLFLWISKVGVLLSMVSLKWIVCLDNWLVIC